MMWLGTRNRYLEKRPSVEVMIHEDWLVRRVTEYDDTAGKVTAILNGFQQMEFGRIVSVEDRRDYIMKLIW